MRSFAKLLASMAMAFLTISLSAQLPHLIHYQGTITDLQGQPYDGNFDIQFRIFDQSATEQWNSGTQQVQVTLGSYSITLGEAPQPPLPPGLFIDNDLLELEVSFDDGVNGMQAMAPRVQMLPVPFALRAATADNVGPLSQIILPDPVIVGTESILQTGNGEFILDVTDGTDLSTFRLDPIGQARLELNGSGNLTVSNIGSSGKDGVSIELGDPDQRMELFLVDPAKEFRTIWEVDGTDQVKITTDPLNDSRLIEGLGIVDFNYPGEQILRFTDPAEPNPFDLKINQPLGQVRLEAGGDHLTVSNIGSSGKDGVRIDVGDLDQEMTWLALDDPLNSFENIFELNGSDQIKITYIPQEDEKKTEGVKQHIFEFPQEQCFYFITDAGDSIKWTIAPTIPRITFDAPIVAPGIEAHPLVIVDPNDANNRGEAKWNVGELEAFVITNGTNTMKSVFDPDDLEARMEEVERLIQQSGDLTTEQHQNSVDQVMERLFTSNLVVLPPPTETVDPGNQRTEWENLEEWWLTTEGQTRLKQILDDFTRAAKLVAEDVNTGETVGLELDADDHEARLEEAIRFLQESGTLTTEQHQDDINQTMERIFSSGIIPLPPPTETVDPGNQSVDWDNVLRQCQKGPDGMEFQRLLDEATRALAEVTRDADANDEIIETLRPLLDQLASDLDGDGDDDAILRMVGDETESELLGSDAFIRRGTIATGGEIRVGQFSSGNEIVQTFDNAMQRLDGDLDGDGTHEVRTEKTGPNNTDFEIRSDDNFVRTGTIATGGVIRAGQFSTGDEMNLEFDNTASVIRFRDEDDNMERRYEFDGATPILKAIAESPAGAFNYTWDFNNDAVFDDWDGDGNYEFGGIKTSNTETDVELRSDDNFIRTGTIATGGVIRAGQFSTGDEVELEYDASNSIFRFSDNDDQLRVETRFDGINRTSTTAGIDITSGNSSTFTFDPNNTGVRGDWNGDGNDEIRSTRTSSTETDFEIRSDQDFIRTGTIATGGVIRSGQFSTGDEMRLEFDNTNSRITLRDVDADMVARSVYDAIGRTVRTEGIDVTSGNATGFVFDPNAGATIFDDQIGAPSLRITDPLDPDNTGTLDWNSNRLRLTVEDDVNPPVVTMVEPASGTTIFEGQTVRMTTLAVDDAGVSRVGLVTWDSNDDLIIEADDATNAPRLTFDPSAPRITLRAEAVDQGLRVESDRAETPRLRVVEDAAPTVRLDAFPQSGELFIEGTDGSNTPTIRLRPATDDVLVEGTRLQVSALAIDNTLINRHASNPNLTLVMPSGTGSNGEVLTTDGAGNLSWGASGGAPSGPAGGSLTGTYPNPGIATGAVTTSEILDGTIATADLGNNSVTGGSGGIIADNSITTDDILAGTIANSDMASNSVSGGAGIGTDVIEDGSINSADIEDNTIGAADIATGAVTSDEILDGTILTGDVSSGGNDKVLSTDNGGNVVWVDKSSLTSAGAGDGLVFDGGNNELDVNPDNSTLEVNTDILRVVAEGITANEIATGAVTTDEILDGTIATSDIATGAVQSVDILDGTIDNADLAANSVSGGAAVGTDVIEDGSINSADISDNSLTTSDLGTGSVASDEIADDAITNDDIAADAIQGGAGSGDDVIENASIDNADLAANSVSGGAAVGTDVIEDGSINSADIADNSLTTSDLGTGSVASDEIANDAITNADLAADAIQGGAGSGDDVIEDASIDAADLATDAVEADEIAANAVGASELASTAVTAGTYGSASQSAQLTIDADGRVTAASSVGISASPSGAAGGDLTGTYPNPTIANDAVTSAKILDGTITGDDVSDNSLSSLDLGTGSVTSDEIGNGSIANIDLAANSVSGTLGAGTDKIENFSIGSNDIGNDVVSPAHLVNTTVAAGSYGSATQVATFTVDADGRLTAAGNTAITGDNLGNHTATTTLSMSANDIDFANGSVADADEVNMNFMTLRGTNELTVRPHASSTAYTWRYPVDGGTNTQFLQTDGSGNTSWAAAPGDNLGNHTATTTLDLNSQNITNGVDATFTGTTMLTGVTFAPGAVTFSGQPVDFSGTEASFLAGASPANTVAVRVHDGSSNTFTVDKEGDVTLDGDLTFSNGDVADANEVNTNFLTLRGTNELTVRPHASSTAYTWRYPVDGGTNTQFLQTDGSGNTSWAAAPGDNLGNHTATQPLNLNNQNVVNGQNASFNGITNLTGAAFTPGAVTFSGQPVDFTGTEADFLAGSLSANTQVLKVHDGVGNTFTVDKEGDVTAGSFDAGSGLIQTTGDVNTNNATVTSGLFVQGLSTVNQAGSGTIFQQCQMVGGNLVRTTDNAGPQIVEVTDPTNSLIVRDNVVERQFNPAAGTFTHRVTDQGSTNSMSAVDDPNFMGGVGQRVINGWLNVTGNVSKGGGSFKIDHPDDPYNKYLYHSFVESPDMMNIYNGNVVTNDSGLAVVEMPDYFESLNRDFRYQLTVIGDFAQAIVAKEVEDGRFAIRTDKPNVKVSWQVTGVRQDVFAEENRIEVEVEKAEDEKGTLLYAPRNTVNR